MIASPGGLQRHHEEPKAFVFGENRGMSSLYGPRVLWMRRRPCVKSPARPQMPLEVHRRCLVPGPIGRHVLGRRPSEAADADRTADRLVEYDCFCIYCNRCSRFHRSQYRTEIRIVRNSENWRLVRASGSAIGHWNTLSQYPRCRLS